MTWNNVQPLCNTCVHYCAQRSQDHQNHQCSTTPHVAYLHSQVAALRQLLSMFPANVAISRTADVNKKTRVCLLISETDVWMIGFDLPGSGDGGIPHHSNVISLHKPIRMTPVPSALHWNPKRTTNVPVDNGRHLIASISVVYQCQGITACYNVVNHFQAYTVQAPSGTDISVQNAVLIIMSLKSLVLSSNNQSLGCSKKIQ